MYYNKIYHRVNNMEVACVFDTITGISDDEFNYHISRSAKEGVTSYIKRVSDKK